MNIIERIKAKKELLEKEKRIHRAIKAGKFMFGEGDYIAYDIKSNGEIEILITIGPIASLSRKEQLTRLRQLWMLRIRDVRAIERKSFQFDAKRGEINLCGVDCFLYGIPQEVIDEVDREINRLALSQSK